jgi:uncharacterized protein (TIGR00730 family)
MKNICIYASSSNDIAEIYVEKTYDLTSLMAEKGWGLIFGGGMSGLMGAAARRMREMGGRITGVIPEKLNVKDVVFENCTELFVTKTLRERKTIMEDRADAFIALPGGYGTMEELLEMITLKQLKYHVKPIVILNINGYYDGLKTVFENACREKFARDISRDLYFFTKEPKEAIAYIENYN